MNATITVYNKYYDSSTGYDKWHRTVIDGVHFEDNDAVKSDKSGFSASDNVFILIPFKSLKNALYMDDMIFDAQLDKTGFFTLRPEDRIVRGEYGDITRSSELDRLTEAYTITSVDKCDYGSPAMHHWEVVAR